MIAYLESFSIMAATYGILALAVNLQWGFTGFMNWGIGVFYLIGAYSSTLITSAQSPDHIGGFGLHFFLGLVGAAVICSIVAYFLSFPTLKIRPNFVAIFLLAVSEIVRTVFINERWLANGIWGIQGIPKPFISQIGHANYDHFYLALTIAILALVYYVVEKAGRSPWGRTLKAIGEDEIMAATSGKNVWKYKMQSFVISAGIAGVAGSLYAHYASYIDPTAFTPWMATFIVWLMVIIGGTGNNRGVILGSFAVWGIWVFSESLANLLPLEPTKVGYLRMMITGLLLWVVLITRPRGILGKPKAISIFTDED